MIRKHKKYSNPRKRYDSARIAEENILVERYALKNKREIWKVEAKVRYLRTRAKKLITAHPREQDAFLAKIRALGLKGETMSDILALVKEDLLQRRLTSILVRRGLAHTPREARQMVSHKRVRISGGVVSSPSYLVPTHEESLISAQRPLVPTKAVKEEATEPAEELKA